MIEISLFTYLISYNICFPWEIWALYLSVDNPQPIKLCSFTLRVMPGVKYQAPLRCIYISECFGIFSFYFLFFFFPLWLDADALGVRLMKSRLSFVQISIRPDFEPRKFGHCKPCYFPSYPLCPRQQDFEQQLSRYIVTSFLQLTLL